MQAKYLPKQNNRKVRPSLFRSSAAVCLSMRFNARSIPKTSLPDGSLGCVSSSHHSLSHWQVQTYNSALRQMCEDIGLPFFDTFAATSRAPSFDGLHYGMDVNLLKAQLLVNFLATGRAPQMSSVVE